jgi:hypothetical protein
MTELELGAISLTPQTRALAITRVNVIDVVDGRIVPNSTVTIRGKTIASVAQNGAPPLSSTRARPRSDDDRVAVNNETAIAGQDGANDEAHSGFNRRLARPRQDRAGRVARRTCGSLRTSSAPTMRPGARTPYRPPPRPRLRLSETPSRARPSWRSAREGCCRYRLNRPRGR